MTTVSKDKDRLLAFVKSTETTLQRAMKHLKLLSESRNGGGNDANGENGKHFDAGVLPVNLSQLLSTLNVHDPSSSPSSSSESSELRATRSLVNLFVDVYQAAFVKMSSMRQELQAQQQHVRRLKAELSDACARGGVAVDFGANVALSGHAWGASSRNLGGGDGYGNCATSGNGGSRFIPRNSFQHLDEDSENSTLDERRREKSVEFATPVKSGQY